MMSMPVWFDIALLASVAISWVVIVFAVVLSVACSKRLQCQTELTQQRYDRLQHELQVTNSSAIGMGQRLVSLERQLKSTVHKQLQFEHAGESQLSYSQAVNLFDTGIAADEVARACGLSQAEASLMEMMHRQMHSHTKATFV